MIIGYVFSRKDNKEIPIIRAGPNSNTTNDKIYLFLKELVYQKFNKEVKYENVVRSQAQRQDKEV